MSIKLLIEQHLVFLSLKGGCKSTLVKCHIVGKHMSRLNYCVMISAEAVKDTAWKVPVQMFTDKKRGKKKEDKHLSKRMRLTVLYG